jgi:hypothetical protein
MKNSILSASLAFCLLFALPPAGVLAQDVVTTGAASPADTLHRQTERIRQMIRSLGAKASTPAQLVQLTRDLPPAAAAGLFLHVAEDYMRSGNWDLAAAVLLQLLDRFPDEPASTNATLLLVRLYSSSEVTHAQRKPLDAAQQLRLPPGWREQQATPEDSPADTGMLLYALYLANGQLQKHPELAENSPLAFQCAVAARLSGRAQENKSWLSLLKHKRESAEWRERALAEEWLTVSRDKKPPLPTTHCLRTNQPPHLDGILEEPLWQNATLVIPQSAIHIPQSELLLAYDAEYFYLAARCQKIPGVEYTADDRPRSYDADLSKHDQVQLWLDADRDYATWFQLAIDHRGWTGDRCWMDAGWNPKWFVAAGSDERSWTFEAAIPWSELAAQPPRSGDIWAYGAERVLPTGRADIPVAAPPADFGLLVFQ